MHIRKYNLKYNLNLLHLVIYFDIIIKIICCINIIDLYIFVSVAQVDRAFAS